MSKKVIILNFELESLSYQAFSEIKQLHLKQELKGEQMAVVTHQGDGSHAFAIKDFLDFTGKNKTAKNSSIGMLIGILGGPLGMVLGWFAGSVYGNAQDVKEVTEAKSIFDFVLEKIGEGETALVLIAEEEDNRPLNSLIFHQLGGHITRLDFEEVEVALKEAKAMEGEIEPETDPHPL